jgi:hypothetical protein
MFGGVISALIVGFILDSRDLYANVVATSYAQGGEDEAFWKGLSEEENRKVQEALTKLRASKEKGKGNVPVDNFAASEEAQPDLRIKKAGEKPEAQPVDMFSDYGS